MTSPRLADRAQSLLRRRTRPLEPEPAQLPAGEAGRAFPGLDPQWSRLVTTEVADGPRSFHVLDNGPMLTARGHTVRGTIVAVHGNPTWSYLWRRVIGAATEQAARTGAGWRVVAPDQLDMGYSERLAHDAPPRPVRHGDGAEATGGYRRFAQRVADLDAVVEALDVDRGSPLITLGHDWGGLVSLAWAVRRAESVDAVTTLNTAAHHRSEDPVPAALRAALVPGVLEASTVETTGFLDVTLSLVEGGLDPEVRAAYRAPYLTRSRRGGIGGFVADVPASADHASRPALDELAAGLAEWDVPSLIMWGPKDPVFRERYLSDLQDRLPQADLHRFETSGHMLAEDSDVAGVLLTWLDERFPGSDGPAPATEPAERRSPEPAGEVLGMHDQLERMSVENPDDPAVVDMTADGASLTWSQLAEEVDALASGLADLGVSPGDRVSLLVPPGNDLTVILYACLRVGAVAVVADAGLGLRGMTRAARSARPDWVIGAAPGLGVARTMRWPGSRISVRTMEGPAGRLLDTVASVESLRDDHRGRRPDSVPTPRPGDQAAVLFTSGSTGPAKGVVYTHERLGALVALLRRQLSVEPGSSLIAGFAPFALLGPAIGATSVTPDMSVTRPATLSAAAVADAARAGRATMLFGSPAALRNIAATADELDPAEEEHLRGVRLVLSAGAPVHPDLLDTVHGIFPDAEIHTPYGMTEGLLQADIERAEVHEAMATGQPGVCVGRPVAGVRFALAPLDAQGVPAERLVDPEEAPGTLSELVVSAAHLKAGYDRLWSTDRASRRDDHRDLLWHRTNDVGHVDDQGRLWIQGRLQHVITTPQGPIGPGVVETPVDGLAEVVRSAAVGVGPGGAQAVVVVVEPESGVGGLRAGRTPVADPEFAARVRGASPVPVAAVLILDELPTDIRHNSKIERSRLAVWADAVLAGRRARTP